MVRPVILTAALLAWYTPVAEAQPAARGNTVVWLDPAWDTPSPAPPSGQPALIPRATVWFGPQLLGSGDAYVRLASRLDGAPRHAFKRLVVDSLKRLSLASWAAAVSTLHRLETQGVVAGCRRHWIVNGFTCELPLGDPTVLRVVPGARRIFQNVPRIPTPVSAAIATVIPDASARPDAYRPDPKLAPWNTRMLGVDRVWQDFRLSGRGVLSAIHDFGWTFAPPSIRATLWKNPGEIPGNGIDDEGDGYVDDVHGFDFDRGDAALTVRGGLPGGLTHGDLTAAFLAGRRLADSAVITGMAPGSRWVALNSTLSMAEALEWAIEHNVDTYSMSFSIPGMGELRAHWRKMMEHATLAGLFLTSGAGNFADSTRPGYAPVPVQMRAPEDMPLVVLGVSGVGPSGTRPAFSSQGPVEWVTDEYAEGRVPKPDFATINTGLLGPDSLGRGHVPGPRGWSGNSFAGPHTAGILALMLEADPELTPWRAREILMQTARDVDPPGFDFQTGAGLVDAYAAVKAARAEPARRKKATPWSLR